MEKIKETLNMAKCAVTGKTTTFGNNVSHSHKRTNKKIKANLKKVRVVENGVHKRIWISARALKSGLVQRA
jgi:large subunit ribosomal protein L28